MSGGGVMVGAPAHPLRAAATKARPVLVGVAVVALAAVAGWALDDGLFPVMEQLPVAVPALVGAGVLFTRFPAATIVAVVALMAFEGSARAFLPHAVPWIRPLIDLLLVGGVVALLWRYLVGGRRRPVFLWPSVVLVAAYLAVTLFQIPLASSLDVGVQSFREAPAFMGAFLVLALYPLEPRQRRRAVYGVVAVMALAAGYAVLRVIIGPAAAEVALTGPFDRPSGDLAAIGTFTGRHVLGGWMSVAIPFCLAVGLVSTGRGRAAAFVAAGSSGVALLASETRVGVVAVGAALVVVVLVLGIGTRPAALRATLVVGLLVALGGGYVAYAALIAGSEQAAVRYERLLRPSQDVAVQQRVLKARLVLADLEQNPLGTGLGTAGYTQRERGRFLNASDRVLDNSLLLVAQQQGYPGMLLFLVSVVSVGVGLALRAVRATGWAAGVGAGAAGSLTALLAIMPAGDYITTWGALLAWVLMGLAAGVFMHGAGRKLQRHVGPEGRMGP